MGKLTHEELRKIKEAAEGDRADMTAFLRAIVKNPGELHMLLQLKLKWKE